MDDIHVKWPAARLYGIPVKPEQALEFIRRTDYALMNPIYCCNNRQFEKDLCELMGFPGPDDQIKDWQAYYDMTDRFKKAFGYVELEHLSSHWVASAYVGGPHGPVHPDGTISLAMNFGKWPTVEEIETDLKLVSENFPWLSFMLFLWNCEGEKDSVTDHDPTHGWHVTGGHMTRVGSPATNMDQYALPAPAGMDAFIHSIQIGDPNREITWSIQQLKLMWGVKIHAAHEAIAPETVDG